MAAERRACPSCGAAALPTDMTCRRCGTRLPGMTRPDRPLPHPPPAPTRQQRYASPEAPVYSKVVEALGGFWDAFPWVVWGLWVVLFVLILSDKLPDPALPLVGLFRWVMHGLLVIWIVFDVLYREVQWWWILVCLFCPIGLWLYWFRGREGP